MSQAPLEAREAGMNPYLEYERRKAEWVRKNPDASPEEYQAAMTAIARRVGI
jgi:hypothetical protein